jgi:hypothetical protein
VWQDQNNYVRFSTVHADGAKLEMALEEGGRYRSELVANDVGTSPRLQIRSEKGRISFDVSKDGASWRPVGPTYEPSFPLAKVGFGATAADSQVRREARFRYFHVGALPSVSGQPPR